MKNVHLVLGLGRKCECHLGRVKTVREVEQLLNTVRDA